MTILASDFEPQFWTPSWLQSLRKKPERPGERASEICFNAAAAAERACELAIALPKMAPDTINSEFNSVARSMNLRLIQAPPPLVQAALALVLKVIDESVGAMARVGFEVNASPEQGVVRAIALIKHMDGRDDATYALLWHGADEMLYAGLNEEAGSAMAAAAARASPPREVIPAKPQTLTSQPARSTQRPTPTKSQPGPVRWAVHYIVEFPSLLVKTFFGGFFGGSIGVLPFVILDRAIYGGDPVPPGQAPAFGIVILVVGSIIGIAGFAIGSYLAFKSGFAKYKQGLDPLD